MSISISGYTTTYNCIKMQYPFLECLDSMLGFCDEVIVVDAGSTDGTLDELEKLAQREKRFRYFVEPVDFTHPRWAIYQDGYLKAKARAKCTGTHCWQTDTDEIVPPQHYQKIRELPKLLGEHKLIMMPMVEFWGSLSVIRGDFFCWKPRFSLNDPNITHGIPVALREHDESGHEYPRPYVSDSCNYIYKDSLVGVQAFVPLALGIDEYNKLGADQVRELFFRSIEMFPSVLHVSWLDLPRKISHYKRFWRDFHASMYNRRPADTAENNVMFNKPWSEVTEEDVFAKADELKAIGPRSFHSKINPNFRGRTFTFTGATAEKIPPALLSWVEKNTSRKKETEIHQLSVSVSEYPLVTAIVPSFNKAKYLPEAVESIVAQDYKNIEILIVNDGSPDDTKTVSEQLIRKFSSRPIRHLEKQNGGISDARNFGIERARGNLILTLDGDDAILPTFTSRAVSEILNNEKDLVCSNVDIFGHAPGEWIPKQYSSYAIRYDNSIPSMTLFRKELWKKSGGYDVSFPFVEDWNFFVACARQNIRVSKLDDKLFRYRSNDNGLAYIFEDSYPQCLAMIVTSHEDLYPVEEVASIHTLVSQFPERFIERFVKQDALHSKSWLLKFWLGMHHWENKRLEIAADLLTESFNLTEHRNWQPAYQMGMLAMSCKQRPIALDLFQFCRTVRPDTQLLVGHYFEENRSKPHVPHLHLPTGEK